MKEPNSIEECVYFTIREIGKCRVKAWVLKEICPKCNQSLMGKPRDSKGKVKIRAVEYACGNCGHREGKDEYEDRLNANIAYTCPHCSHQGGTTVPFKRKKVKILDEDGLKMKTVESLRFQCESCKKNIDIVKKMKA